MVRMFFRLEVSEVALVNRNLVNNAYLYESRVFYTFTTNKLVRSLMNV